MKKNKKLLGLCTVLASVFLIAGGLTRDFNSAQADTTNISEIDIPTKLYLNSEFTMPSGSITQNGTTKEAQKTLISPSGIAYDGQTVILDETGEWSLRFTATIDGKICQEEKKFIVYRDTYELTSEDGSISVGMHELFPESGDGLIVDIPKEGEFRYNDIVDLRKTDALQSFIELAPIPNIKGVANFTKMYITLTDAYNPDLCVRYMVQDPNEVYPGVYPGISTVCASYNDEGWMAHISDKGMTNGGLNFGSWTTCSFDGSIPSIASLSYDDVENVAHVVKKLWIGKVPHNIYKTAICDFSGNYWEALQKNFPFSEPFKGFTTGEVYLSISLGGVTSTSGKVFIKSINGADFTKGDSYDVIPPILEVETVQNENGALPYAKINTPFKLFSAKAYDNELTRIDVSTNVYYMNGLQKLYNVETKNGMFTPKKAGIYGISYVAVDGFGNKTEELIYVEAKEAINKPIGKFVDDYVTQANFGEWVELADFEPKVFSGNPKVIVQVRQKGIVLEENISKFMPKQVGKYYIAYVVEDYIGQVEEFGYEVEVAYSKNPLLEKQPVSPNGFIAGHVYTLTAPEAYDYYTKQGEKLAIKAMVAVDEGDGAVDLTDGKYTPTGNSDTVTVIYTYTSASGETVITHSNLPVVKIEDLGSEYTKYFLPSTDKVVVEKKEESLVAWFSGDASLSYVKEIPLQNSSFVLNVFKEEEIVYNNANRIDFILSDTVDETKYVKISIFRVGDAVEISWNDGETYQLRGSFTEPEADFNFIFNNKDKMIEFFGDKMPIEKYANGEAFNGFTRSKGYLKIIVSGMEEDQGLFGLEMYSIAGQFLSFNKDFMAPIITVEENRKIVYEINDLEQTSIAYSTDMIGTTTTTLTFRDPHGNSVIAEEGTVLENVDADKVYTVKFAEYGNYKAIYTAKDNNDRVIRRELTYKVEDSIAPEISLSKRSMTCKLNETVSLPKISFSDNVTNSKDLICHIAYFDPQFRCYRIKDVVKAGNTCTGEITFNIAGTWKIVYMVYDANYNLSKVELIVTVR